MNFTKFYFLGEEMIGYLYVHAKFKWSLLVYTVFIGYYMIMCLTGLLLAAPLLSWMLKVSDARLGAVGCVSRFIASVFIALSTNSLMVFIGILPTWIQISNLIFNSTLNNFFFIQHHFYIAATVGMLSNLASVSVRTIMSKIVEQDELGTWHVKKQIFPYIKMQWKLLSVTTLGLKILDSNNRRHWC